MAKVTKQVVPRARQRSAAGAAVPAPPVGGRLRAAVDVVLAELTDAADADPVRLQKALRVALAWTAAAGETCQVLFAVTAVRQAQGALAADDRQQALAALLAARDGLRDAD